MRTRYVYLDGSCSYAETKIEKRGDMMIASIPAKEIEKNVDHIDFLYDYFQALAGDEGYFITNQWIDGVHMTKFTERDDCEIVHDQSMIGCYGWNQGKGGLIGIVTGMRCDFGMVLGVKNQKYYTYPRFSLEGDGAYEDIAVRFYNLQDGSYASMARKYREYQLNECGCVPLKMRVKENAILKKSAESVAVRVRMGWKPVPSPVEYQTEETEPEMHVACTFQRAGDIADEFKRQGIDNAEFCLVGWNCSGHDGRFPQLLPVEERLGGEKDLRALIQKMKAHGYHIVAHDNTTDAYTIADCFNEKFIVKKKDGSVYKRMYCWAGGRPHKVCPQKGYEFLDPKNQKIMKDLGFEGIHYVDCVTIAILLKCYDKEHPLNRKQSAEWYRKTMKYSRENFGGFSSEGSYDFASSDVDYILYAENKSEPDESTPLCDRIVPFWQIAYHGIILYNPSTVTLNYAAKEKKNRLKYFECGGRPLIYFNANFAKGNHWMGTEDFLCDTEEQMNESVKMAKQMVRDYELLAPERYEFIENHEEIEDGVFCTTYSNGTKVFVDYNKESFEIERIHKE